MVWCATNSLETIPLWYGCRSIRYQEVPLAIWRIRLYFISLKDLSCGKTYKWRTNSKTYWLLHCPPFECIVWEWKFWSPKYYCNHYFLIYLGGGKWIHINGGKKRNCAESGYFSVWFYSAMKLETQFLGGIIWRESNALDSYFSPASAKWHCFCDFWTHCTLGLLFGCRNECI